MSKHLKFYEPPEIAALVSRRDGEVKLGERLEFLSGIQQLQQSKATFILVGICEDIGILANLGVSGAKDAWSHFLKAFLNQQSNYYLDTSKVAVLGALEFPKFQKEAADLDPSDSNGLAQLRSLTSYLDKEVEYVVYHIVKSGKVPIVIGGGHNNSYPIIKATARALKSKLSVLNIDPHTDYRALEGRHSGNGFRYAREEGYLKKYAVYGLHQGYNSDDILQEFKGDPELTYLSFEKLLPLNNEARAMMLNDLLHWLGAENMGLEIDLDSLSNFPVSAINPSGFSLNDLRTNIYEIASIKAPTYLHLAEASPGRAETSLETALIGKSLSYLVTDFIKALT